MRLLGPRYHLLLIGSGAQPPRQGNVTHRPYEARGDELARLMASCDVFVHAGDQETFGLVVLEAMACALPVVGMRAGSVAELVNEDTGVVARPGDASSLAEAITALYGHNPHALGLRARAHVKAHYRWDRICADLLSRYAQLARVKLPIGAEVGLHAASS